MQGLFQLLRIIIGILVFLKYKSRLLWYKMNGPDTSMQDLTYMYI